MVQLYCGSWGKVCSIHFMLIPSCLSPLSTCMCALCMLHQCEKDLSPSLAFILVWKPSWWSLQLSLWENEAAYPFCRKYTSWNQGSAWELIWNGKTYWGSQLFAGSLSWIVEFLQAVLFCKASPWCAVLCATAVQENRCFQSRHKAAETNLHVKTWVPCKRVCHPGLLLSSGSGKPPQSTAGEWVIGQNNGKATETSNSCSWGAQVKSFLSSDIPVTCWDTWGKN